MVQGEEGEILAMNTGKHGLCLGQREAAVCGTQSSPEKQVKTDLGR